MKKLNFKSYITCKIKFLSFDRSVSQNMSRRRKLIITVDSELDKPFNGYSSWYLYCTTFLLCQKSFDWRHSQCKGFSIFFPVIFSNYFICIFTMMKTNAKLVKILQNLDAMKNDHQKVYQIYLQYSHKYVNENIGLIIFSCLISGCTSVC